VFDAEIGGEVTKPLSAAEGDGPQVDHPLRGRLGGREETGAVQPASDLRPREVVDALADLRERVEPSTMALQRELVMRNSLEEAVPTRKSIWPPIRTFRP
jgi:hypothetical protein